MMVRRGFLFTSSAALIAAPAIVRISSLMRVHNLGLPQGQETFSMFERWPVRLAMREIAPLSGEGLSPEGIAAELNRRAAAKPNNIHSCHWDAKKVKFVIAKDQLIRGSDRSARRGPTNFSQVV